MSTANIFLSTSNLVGIGTTNPTAQLYVSGNLYVSNTVTTTNVYLLPGVTSSTAANITKGAIELNATSNIFYGTPMAGIRGLIPAQYFYQLNADTTFGTTTGGVGVSAFPGLSTGVTLQPGRYYIKMLYILQITTSATAGSTSLQFGWGGGGSLTNGGITVLNVTSTTGAGSLIGAPSINLRDFTGVTSAQVSDTTTAVSTAESYYNIIEGTFDITTAGGWYPTATITSPGTFTATPGARRGSYIYLQNIGVTGANINIGGWA